MKLGRDGAAGGMQILSVHQQFLHYLAAVESHAIDQLVREKAGCFVETELRR
jgi:hypothetical protein